MNVGNMSNTQVTKRLEMKVDKGELDEKLDLKVSKLHSEMMSR